MNPSAIKTTTAALALGGWLLASVARAQDPPKAKARQHFAQGIESYDRGDYEAAVRSYEKAFALMPFPVITFNIGLAYEKLGRPVKAVDAMERVLAEPGTLRPQRLAQARSTLEAQRRLVAELRVTCNVEGASLRLDGEEIATLPLAAPLPVAAGSISLMATKDGYQPGFVRVTAQGGADHPVTIALVESTLRPAQLQVQTTLPDAELYVDGQLVARTPLRGTIPLVPGKPQRVELRRAGYRTASETLTLSEGATASVSLEPVPDEQALAAEGGELVLRLAQPDASIFVNGQRREIGASGRLRLPAGPHAIAGDRDGYDRLNLRVVVPPGGSVERRIDLIPTPQTRAQLVGDAELEQGLGWGLTLGGAVLGAAGAGILGWSVAQRSEASATVDRIDEATGAYAFCDQGATDEERNTCNLERSDAASAVDRHQAIQIGAGLGLALGAAALTTGIVYLVTGEDPDQYRLELDDDLFAMRATPWLAPGQGGVGLTGRF